MVKDDELNGWAGLAGDDARLQRTTVTVDSSALRWCAREIFRLRMRQPRAITEVHRQTRLRLERERDALATDTAREVLRLRAPKPPEVWLGERPTIRTLVASTDETGLVRVQLFEALGEGVGKGSGDTLNEAFQKATSQ